jgi:hypothetical protein
MKSSQILGLGILGVVAYFLFFKKKGDMVKKVETPKPATETKPTTQTMVEQPKEKSETVTTSAVGLNPNKPRSVETLLSTSQTISSPVSEASQKKKLFIEMSSESSKSMAITKADLDLINYANSELEKRVNAMSDADFMEATKEASISDIQQLIALSKNMQKGMGKDPKYKRTFEIAMEKMNDKIKI